MALQTVESVHIAIEIPDQHPGTLAKTIVARPRSGDARTELERMRDVWREVARHGCVADVDTTEPDSDSSFFGEFPDWYRPLAEKQFDWQVYLYDRDWIWWSSDVVGQLIKIDIRCDGMPTGTYPLIHLIEACNCAVLYDDMWIGEAEVRQMA